MNGRLWEVGGFGPENWGVKVRLQSEREIEGV